MGVSEVKTESNKKDVGVDAGIRFERVYLEGADVKRCGKLGKGVKVVAKVDMRVFTRSTKRRAYVREVFKITGIPEGREKPLYKMEFGMVAEYKTSREIGDKEENELASDRGMRDIFPYARDFVQAMTVSMGMPSLVMVGYSPEWANSCR
ncbi:MAG: hypothetical protein KKB90_00065 [Actinobacteria bacterium]|nr:hypothetical protein [Actinomycetota bacterium]MBU4217343.1 hypothetical protein [Actinomycetota bacterium]MBU4359504.1 hypothetical protein [Actinomycetota bacterium]MBU4392894.1 hypothetical protein [Actinomycetota bacterium]MBU4403525.1 hypothetical protein [Actinomycetota bacterium]